MRGTNNKKIMARKNRHYNVFVQGRFLLGTWVQNKKQAIEAAYFHHGYGYSKSDFTAELDEDQDEGPYLVTPGGRRVPIDKTVKK